MSNSTTEIDHSPNSWTKSGTPGFAAPENLKNLQLDVTEMQRAKAADMWGFGMTIYYFEYNKLPFEELNFIDRIEALSSLDLIYNDSLLSGLLQGLLNRDLINRFDTDACRRVIQRIPEWPILKGKKENLSVVLEVTQTEIDGAFKKVHLMATVIKAVARFKRGGSSRNSMESAEYSEKTTPVSPLIIEQNMEQEEEEEDG